jgi:DNA-binding transcriptional regulator YdaS (Cro superfamily)
MRKVASLTHNQDPRRERHGFRGTPPPADFSLADLADGALLTEFQVGALIQVSTNTIQSWRRQPDHPLAWATLPNGFVRYRAGALRNYLALGRRRRKPIARAEPASEAAAPQTAPSVERLAALKRAIALLGSQEKLARAAGVHVNSIWKALHQHSAIGRRLALAIERVTEGEVRAEELILEGAQRTPKRQASEPKNHSHSERSETSVAKTIAPDAKESPKPMPKNKRRTAARDEPERNFLQNR